MVLPQNRHRDSRKAEGRGEAFDKPVVFSGVPTYTELFLSSDGTDLGGTRLGSYLN